MIRQIRRLHPELLLMLIQLLKLLILNCNVIEKHVVFLR